MTTYRLRENTGKKLLVPVIALLLCSFALIGVSHAALSSSMSSGNNSVGSDGIVLTFVDNSGNNIASGAFSSNHKYDWGCDTVMNGASTTYTYTYGPFTNAKIGESKLKIDATDSTVEQLKITYVFTTNLSGGGLPAGMTVSVKIGSSTVNATTGLTQSITPGSSANNFNIEVLLSSTEQTTSTVPQPFTYTLKVIAEPVAANP